MAVAFAMILLAPMGGQLPGALPRDIDPDPFTVAALDGLVAVPTERDRVR